MVLSQTKREKGRAETITSNNSLRSLCRLKYRGSIRTIPNEALAAWLETQHKAPPKGGRRGKHDKFTMER